MARDRPDSYEDAIRLLVAELLGDHAIIKAELHELVRIGERLRRADIAIRKYIIKLEIILEKQHRIKISQLRSSQICNCGDPQPANE